MFLWTVSAEFQKLKKIERNTKQNKQTKQNRKTFPYFSTDALEVSSRHGIVVTEKALITDC